MSRSIPPPPTRYGPLGPGQVLTAKPAPGARPASRPQSPPPPRPGPPAPAAPAREAGTLQKAHAGKLNKAARKILWKNRNDSEAGKTIKGCQEVQVMYINGAKFISGNTEDDNEAILASTYASTRNIKRVGVAGCAKAAAAGTVGMWVLGGGSGSKGSEVHAEQNLLRIVDYMIQYRMLDGIDTPIEVWGTKPPCGRCAQVLTAYADALYKRFGKHLLFEGRSFDQLREEHPDVNWDPIELEARHPGANVLLDKGRPNVTPEDVRFYDERQNLAAYSDFQRDYEQFKKITRLGVTRRQFAEDEIRQQQAAALARQQMNSQPSLVHRNVAPPKQKTQQTKTTQQMSTKQNSRNQNQRSPQKRSYCQSIAYGLAFSVVIGTALWMKFGMGGDGTA